VTAPAAVTVMWTWDASGPGAAASGVCGEAGDAQRAASEWMRANGADSGLVEQVRLALGAGGNLATRHEPTGVTLRASRGQDGQVRWEAARRSA
jgi:hypothetical protein